MQMHRAFAPPTVRTPSPSLAGLKPAKLPLDKYVDSE